VTSEVGTPAASGLGIGLGSQGLQDGLMLATLENQVPTARDPELWNAQRTKDIVELLRPKWGRVCQDGVQRCAERLGLATDWEEGEVAENGQKTRILSLAGNALLIDVEWVGEIVRNVVMSFPNAGGGMEKSAARGATVLKRNLVGSGEPSCGYLSLKDFAANLESLAKMDQLVRQGSSCFEAINGLYASLERIWEWELVCARKEMRENGRAGDDDAIAERQVLLQKSGRPGMHEGRTIGLRLDYWKHGVPPPPGRQEGCKGGMIGEEDEDTSGDCELLIGCEACSSDLYTPIRVSDNWVSESVGRAIRTDDIFTGSTSYVIDWQDPPPTFLPASDEGNAMQVDLDLMGPPQSLPNARFVARLNPPITLPLQTVIEIHNLMGQPLLQDSIQPTTYLSLLLGPSLQTSAESSEPMSAPDFRRVRSVRTWYDDGTSSSRPYEVRLLVLPLAWARTLSEIPFAHPKNLVLILPILRQWAFFGNMLRRTFSIEHGAQNRDSQEPPTESANAHTESSRGKPSHANGVTKYSNNYRPPTPPSDTDSEDDGHADQSANTHGFSATSGSVLEVSFAFDALPRIDLSCSISTPGRSRSEVLNFHIEPNAIVMGDRNGEHVETRQQERADASPDRERSRKCARALEVCQDLGILAEWMRSKGFLSDEDVIMKEA
jgi:hypothetical protein